MCPHTRVYAPKGHALRPCDVFIYAPEEALNLAPSPPTQKQSSRDVSYISHTSTQQRTEDSTRIQILPTHTHDMTGIHTPTHLAKITNAGVGGIFSHTISGSGITYCFSVRSPKARDTANTPCVRVHECVCAQSGLSMADVREASPLIYR